MIKMKQENYAKKQNKKCSILFVKPLTGTKLKLFSAGRIKTENKKHIELRKNAAISIPSASSNYILSIILY